MSKITRRETLARGGQAVAAVAVLTTLPSIAAAKEDAELFAQYERCRWLEKKYIAAINRYEEPYFAVRRRPPELKGGALAEAMKQAGVPALEKKKDAAERAYLAAEDRFYDMPAHSPAGMILKLTYEWTDRMRRDWRAKGIAADVQFHPDAIPSVLLDIERLCGRAI